MYTVQTLSQVLSKAEGQKQLLEKQHQEAITRQQCLTEYQKSIELATVLIQKVAKETQEQLQFHIEDIVQLAIEACFPEEYQFKLEFESKRGRTEARIFLLKNGIETDPMESNGGGLVDIISFGLRIAAWSLSRGAKLIVLDEPFKFLDKDRKPLAMGILKQLSSRLKLQIIDVTHDKEMVDISDKVAEVRSENMDLWKVSKVYG